MDLTGGFVSAVRKALRLRPSDPDELWRHGLYRCRVDVCASDGSTVDVTPEDDRLSPQKGVPVRVGIPGAVAVVSQGAVVLLGWEGGNPAKAYAVPAWESAASVTKLILNASALYLGGESGAEKLVRKSDYDGHTHSYGTLVGTSVSGGAVTLNGGITGGAAAATGTTNTRAK